MRRKIAVLGSLLAVGALGLGASVASAASINVGSASGNPGDTVSVDVTLSTGGADIAGTQNDITFDASAPVARKANGKPDCTVNPDIDKTASSFAFRPANCTAETCTSIRALVLSTDNTTPIPDSSVLYTCKVAISASATGGAKALTASGVILSSPSGTRVTPADSTNGAVTVGGGGEVTPTPTVPAGETPTPGGGTCDPVRPAPAAPALYIDDLNLDAAGDATISVKLASGSAEVAGTQNDFTFAGTNVVVKRKTNGKPDCTVNPDIDKTASSFAFRPANCTEATCTSVRGLVLSTDNTTPIPDGSVLYTCNVTVTAPGGALDVTGVILSTPAGSRVDGATGRGGNICVGGGATPGPTNTPGGGGMCDAVRPAPAAPALYIEDLNLGAAGSGTISVKLASGTAEVAGTQNDFGFGGNVVVNRKTNGKPDCTVNPAIDKMASSFAFRPANCTEATCTSVRGLVLSTDNTTPIPDGSVLYTCNITVTGMGTTTLPVSGVILSTPSGSRVNGVTSQDGKVCVPGGVIVNTPTPTVTVPVVPTATHTVPVGPTATATGPARTATATATRVATAAGTATVLEDEGGCRINATGTTSSGWLLLIPVAAILVIRRRSR